MARHISVEAQKIHPLFLDFRNCFVSLLTGEFRFSDGKIGICIRKIEIIHDFGEHSYK